MKALLSTVLFCLWAWHATAQTAIVPSGSGSQNDPYLIENLNHLYWMSSQPSSTLSGKYFLQTQDINASETSSWFPNSGNNAGWPPIATGLGNSFSGIYDGNNYSISNLYINNTNLAQAGLFGNLNGSSISNLHLINLNFTCNSTAGGIAGSSTNSSIYNCSTSGTIYSTGSSVGGISGKVFTISSINLCHSSCQILASDKAGGLIGEISSSSANNCFARGDVTRISGSASNFGGAVGYASSSSFQYCYSTGAVIYSAGNSPTNKGFAGTQQSSTFTAVFFDSNTSGQTTSDGGSGLSTSEMKSYQHFFLAGYDLRAETENGTSDYWAMSETVNNAYLNLDKIQRLSFSQTNSSNWHDAANWSPSMIPDLLCDIDIPSGKTVLVFADSSAKCRSLSVSSSSSIRFLANANESAELFCMDIANSGSIIQEVWLPGGWTNAASNWHLIASPAGEIPVSSIIPDSGDYDLYSWDEPTATWINHKYNASPIPFDDNLLISKGYLISYSQNQVLELQGTPHLNSFSPTNLSNTNNSFGGWNLLGNPYPHAVIWKGHEISPANTTQIAKLWSSSNEAYQDIFPNDTIPKASGFFVCVDENLKSKTINYESITGYITLQLMDNNRKQDVHFLIHPEATEHGFDTWDAGYLQAIGRQFYWSKEQNCYSTISYPETADTLELSLNIKSDISQLYHLKLIRQSLPFNLCLIDLKSQTCHPLSESAYTFTHHPEDVEDRFILRMIKTEVDHKPNCCEDRGQNSQRNSILIPVLNGKIVYPQGWNEQKSVLFDLQGREVKTPTSGVYLLKQKR